MNGLKMIFVWFEEYVVSGGFFGQYFFFGGTDRKSSFDT